MGNLSRSSPDLKCDKDAICGRGKAAVVYLVRNTVTKVPQLWKWIHNPNHEASGEHFVLELLQGHDNIQKMLHWDKSNQVLVTKFANGGDLHNYTLDHYGATRQQMPEILLWHYLRSMAASLAYCQAGWRDGDPFIAKEGWRPVVHQDIVAGNILLHWHQTQLLPQLILTDFGDAKLLDEMPDPRFDFLLQAMRRKDPEASHLKRELWAVGGNLQSMLVAPFFGGNAQLMQEHNVAQAFDYARQRDDQAFSPELAQWVEKLEYNESTGRGTKFTDALEFARELIPVADSKIAELSKTAAILPGRQTTRSDHHDGLRSFRAPLEKDVRAFIDYYGVEDAEVIVGLARKHKQGSPDPQYFEYKLAHIDELLDNEEPRSPPSLKNGFGRLQSLDSYDGPKAKSRCDAAASMLKRNEILTPKACRNYLSILQQISCCDVEQDSKEYAFLLGRQEDDDGRTTQSDNRNI